MNTMVDNVLKRDKAEYRSDLIYYRWVDLGCYFTKAMDLDWETSGNLLLMDGVLVLINFFKDSRSLDLEILDIRYLILHSKCQMSQATRVTFPIGNPMNLEKWTQPAEMRL